MPETFIALVFGVVWSIPAALVIADEHSNPVRDNGLSLLWIVIVCGTSWAGLLVHYLATRLRALAR